MEELCSTNGKDKNCYSYASTQYILCECGKIFTGEDLEKHLKSESHTAQKKFYEHQCNECTRVFSSARECIHHIKSIHLKNHNQIDVQTEEIEEEIFELPKKIRRRRNYGPSRFVCDVCGKEVKSNAALTYHQRVHTGEKPYKCTYCPKAFSMPLFLQIHIRSHTGERPYKCTICPKAFAHKAGLTRHERVHSGEKPYECPKCQRHFSQSNSMKVHIATVHLKLPTPYKSKRRSYIPLPASAELTKEAIRKIKVRAVKSKKTQEENEYANGIDFVQEIVSYEEVPDSAIFYDGQCIVEDGVEHMVEIKEEVEEPAFNCDFQ